MATEPRPNTLAVADLHLTSDVVDINLDGTLTLADGRTMQKDLIILADGIRVRTTRSPLVFDLMVFSKLVEFDC